MKAQLKLIIFLLAYLNILLTVDLIRRIAVKARAESVLIQKVDIVKVGGRWITYGSGLPIER